MSDYPSWLEHDVTLEDGRVVHVRPVTPDDLGELRRAIANADPETLYQRFLGAAPPHTHASLRRLVELDYRQRLAVAAFEARGHGVAIARYEGAPGSTAAEVAVVVDPAWRHIGLATDLVNTLARAAMANGITRFTATTLAANWDVQDIVALSGAPYTKRQHGDVVEDVVEITS